MYLTHHAHPQMYKNVSLARRRFFIHFGTLLYRWSDLALTLRTPCFPSRSLIKFDCGNEKRIDCRLMKVNCILYLGMVFRLSLLFLSLSFFSLSLSVRHPTLKFSHWRRFRIGSRVCRVHGSSSLARCSKTNDVYIFGWSCSCQRLHRTPKIVQLKKR